MTDSSLIVEMSVASSISILKALYSLRVSDSSSLKAVAITLLQSCVAFLRPSLTYTVDIHILFNLEF